MIEIAVRVGMVKAVGAMTRMIQKQRTATHKTEATGCTSLRSIGHRLAEAPALQMITGIIPIQQTSTQPEATVGQSLRIIHFHMIEELVLQSTETHTLNIPATGRIQIQTTISGTTGI
jgi:hypothetical protein